MTSSLGQSTLEIKQIAMNNIWSKTEKKEEYGNVMGLSLSCKTKICPFSFSKTAYQQTDRQDIMGLYISLFFLFPYRQAEKLF